MCSSNCLLVIIAIVFPPLPVWVKRGLCSGDSLINIALCCLGFIPGLIHAWYIISVTPDYYEYDQIDVESGRQAHRPANYYYVVAPNTQAPSRQAPTSAQQPPHASYGGVDTAQGSRDSTEVPPSYNEAIKGDHKVQKP